MSHISTWPIDHERAIFKNVHGARSASYFEPSSRTGSLTKHPLGEASSGFLSNNVQRESLGLGRLVPPDFRRFFHEEASVTVVCVMAFAAKPEPVHVLLYHARTIVRRTRPFGNNHFSPPTLIFSNWPFLPGRFSITYSQSAQKVGK
jgi:hypothetical protein